MKKKFLTANELRSLWARFWQTKEHVLIPPSSLVSSHPSLLWVNSGVAGLRDFFLGIKKTASKKLFNIQRSVRTNDIDNIGKTNRHLTFFEMMGNFSLNDYHKKEAIIWAWEFVTSKSWLGLDISKLYITVYEKDYEAIRICQKDLKIADGHLILGDKTSNFWDLGVGPCGPNLEIFYDLGEKFDPNKQGITFLQKNIENDRYLEIWNIVFSEFLHIGDGNYRALSTKNIDTGAGLERLLTILQNKNNCFETDLFFDIITFIAQKLQTPFISKTDPFLDRDQKINNCRLKIITDHIRTISFLLTDLFLSSEPLHLNNKRGYTIKKLIRNASLQVFLLGYHQPFLSTLIPMVIKKMQDFYPQLQQKQKEVTQTVLKEEIKFLQLLQNKKISSLLSLPEKSKVSGEKLFRLVTEVGFPLPILKKIALERHLFLDLEQFNLLFTQHQKASQVQKNSFLNTIEALQTESIAPTKFVWEKTTFFESKILAIFPDLTDSKTIIQSKEKKFWIILNTTIFFAERGGQIYDIGTLKRKKDAKIENPVINVQVNAQGQYLHLVVLKEKLQVGDNLILLVNNDRRKLIRNNHSSTHLLHFALRKIISLNIRQNGSFNNEDYLRLDFFHAGSSLNLKQLQSVENKVNDLIKEKITPHIIWVNRAQIRKQKILNFFNIDSNNNEKWRSVEFANYSKELCGGFHVLNTGNIESFLITKYKKISDNNHRIYAITTFNKVKQHWKTFQNDFALFLHKYNLTINKLIQNKSLRLLWNKMNSSKNFFLEYQKYQLELQKLIVQKISYKKKETVRLNSNYLIPAQDLFLIQGYYVIFHLLKSNSAFDDLVFLRNVYDQNKRNAKTLLFLFIERTQGVWNFMFHFNEQLSEVDWKQIVSNCFADSIKFGQKANKFQGVLLTADPKIFWPILCQNITNILNDYKK